MHAAIDAALQLRSEDKVQPDQIKRIDTEIPVDQYLWFDGKSVERVFCFLQEVIPNYEH